MRAIGRAELGYNVAFPANGFACSLAALGGDPKSGAPSPQAAQLLDPQVASTGQTSGYTFTIANCTKVRVNNRDTYISYHVTGVPQAIDRTGDNGYCSDDSLIIKTDPTGGTNCTEPIRYAGPRL
jgi:type IV pilus assembly protein PilA